MNQKKIAETKNFLEKAGAMAILQILALPAMMSAQVNDVPSMNVPNNISINNMLGKISSYFFGIVIAACVFMVLWGAFDFATSGGDETKVSKAKKRILYAVIGLIVAAMASVIVGLVVNVATHS
jgi:uncharacterized membrane protein